MTTKSCLHGVVWTLRISSSACGPSSQMDLMHHWQPCFRNVSAILIVLSTVVAKDAISSFRVQSDPSTDSLSSISLLGWLKTCPEDLANGTREPSCSWLLGEPPGFFFIFSVSQRGHEGLLEPGA